MRGHKYGAKATTVDNIRFASKAEAKRYGELKMLEKAKQITALRLQPRFELFVDNGGYPDNDQGRAIVLGDYVADFAYKLTPASDTIYEDVKGYDVPLQKWKRRHAEAQYGITVVLITKAKR